MFSCVSPCKLNLFLYITGKRPDGYHDLQTLFVILSHGDVMHFDVDSKGEVELLTDFNFSYKQNLIYKAAVLLKEHCKCRLGVKIAVDKILPQGGGLGGGSGNAGTTLLVLNKLWKLNLGEQELLDLAVTLGADVPIFIKGKTCFAQGIGDRLQEVDFPRRWYLVCNPKVVAPTAALFKDPLLEKNSPARTYEQLLEIPFDNCFTKVVAARYPAVGSLLQAMSKFGRSRMTGSGSSCFLEFESAESARHAQLGMRKLGYAGFVAPSGISPVLTAIDSLR